MLFGGKNLANIKKNELETIRNQHFGFVYQYFNLIDSLSVIENISMPLLIAGRTKKEAFREADNLLTKFKLNGLKDRNIKGLSGGEKQRVSLLRAIINKPDVIFADEPTGALDEIHGIEVMETLKELSKEKLVILVSHNEKLVTAFADFHVRLEDGHIIASDLVPSEEQVGVKASPKRSKGRWISLIFPKHLKNNRKKNIFTIISSMVGFLTINISVGFFNGSKDVAQYETKKLLTRYVAGISKIEKVEIKDSPLSLNKLSRPTTSEVKNIVSENIEINYDLSYFFPSKNTISVDKQTAEVNLIPLLLKKCSVYRNLLYRTSRENESDPICYVNDEFLSVFRCTLNQAIHVSYDMTVLIDNIKENVSIEEDFIISGFVSEFSFLNEPRIYYDYQDVYEHLSAYEIYSGGSLLKLIEEAESCDAASNFQLKMFALNEAGAEEIEKLNERANWSISSNYLTVKQSFAGLQNALDASLIPFIVLELLMIVFICGFVSFSAFLDQKKEAAILNSLGSPKSSLRKLYIYESVSLSLIGTSLALALSLPAQLLLNAYLSKRLGLLNLINIPYGFIFIILVILVSLILSTIGTLIPMRALYKYPLSEALREE